MALTKVDPVVGTQRDTGRRMGGFLRLFPAAVLRDVGGGGETGGWRVLSLLNKWGTGKYLEVYYAPVRPRAVAKGRPSFSSAGGAATFVQRTWRRVMNLGRYGYIL